MCPRPIPPEVREILTKTKAPPRLVAHLALVHHAACQLTSRLEAEWPGLAIDRSAVHLGAASHDIGKAIYPKELSEPGHEHEIAGQDLLIGHGWPKELSRFAVTHGWILAAGDPIEDLLVALADNVWKGSREGGLEQAVVMNIASATGQEAWQVWLTLDDILTNLCEGASGRLLWQASHHL